MRCSKTRRIGSLGLFFFAAQPLAFGQSTERISSDLPGFDGYTTPSISPDGRYVVYQAEYQFGSPPTQVYMRDRQTQQLRLISARLQGGNASGFSAFPVVSRGGRYVAFASSAGDLVPNGDNAIWDVFVRDTVLNVTTCISVGSLGQSADRESGRNYSSSISGDGSRIAFTSVATNLAPPFGNFTESVFVRDRQTGQTLRVSVNSAGVNGNAISRFPVISENGRLVVFSSFASNLVTGDTNGFEDVFVHDLQTHQTARVSISSQGHQGNAPSAGAAISADGRFVAFGSSASNLVERDVTPWHDLFIHDRVTGVTRLVSMNLQGVQANESSFSPAISSDGRFVSFTSVATNLVPGSTDKNDPGTFILDQASGRIEQVNVGSQGELPNGATSTNTASAMTADARAVTFASFADNLVKGDQNDVSDVFARQRHAPCRADFNEDGVTNTQDFFVFLAEFFEARFADFNRDGAIDSRDVMEFVEVFLDPNCRE